MTPRPLRKTLTNTLGLGLCFLILSCGGGGKDTGGAAKSGDNAGTSAKGANQAEYDTEIPMVTYAWDPQAGDPAVSAEDGGPGFTGEGWTTNMTFPAQGTPEAKKGGTIHMDIPDWPATLRLQGKDYNTSFNYRARDLCQESLLFVHPQTLELCPLLATHWKISEDKSTYTFRINPEARWSDGREVVAQDIVATYNLLMDDTLLFPSNKTVYGKFEVPVALSKYIVQVKVKEESWRNLMYFAGTGVFPAHEISIPGDEYLKEYQNRYTALTGPYYLEQSGIEMNKSLTLTRRDDWWAKDNPAFVGLYNFDAYNFQVITDQIIAFEKAKKGEIDYYVPPKAQWWVEELTPKKLDFIKRGLIQKRKFYNDAPVGTSGFALNVTRAPLDDLNVRKALALLRNRPLMIDKLFFNEYEPLDSYWQFGDYRNPNNGMTPYDPFEAVELLKASGWTELDSEGYRTKDGKRLEFELCYRSVISEPSLTIYQEDCKKAGIQIKLKLLDPAAFWKNVRQREYSIASMAWGALVFPNPETSWSGELAKVVDNNNITAFSDARVDELLGEYDREYDPSKRSAIIREMDGIIFAAHPYVLDWYGPSQRVIYQNKFKMPKWGTGRTADRDSLMYSWWIDPDMEAQLEKARTDTSITLKTEPEANRFWQAWNEANAK
ncbi:MAG: ABC transporter substrate-binding protein [Planctomycetes bacterium]|nr:ABC transporter substrate-binding protein [Planctomycetota bacterium]